MPCHIDSPLIVPKVNIALIGPNNFAPIFSVVRLIFLCPSHVILCMSDMKVGDLACYSSVVSCISQNISNGCITDFWINRVGNLLKQQSVLFHGGSDNEAFSIVCNTPRAARARQVSGRTCGHVLLPDAVCTRGWDAHHLASLMNRLSTKDNTNEPVFLGGVVLSSGSLISSHFMCKNRWIVE